MEWITDHYTLPVIAVNILFYIMVTAKSEGFGKIIGAIFILSNAAVAAQIWSKL